MSDKDAKKEGRIANVKGVPRNKNPYKAWDGEGKYLDWDTGWLMQTQSWAGKPVEICKGEGCTAERGDADNMHSKACHKEHDFNVDRCFSIF